MSSPRSLRPRFAERPLTAASATATSEWRPRPPDAPSTTVIRRSTTGQYRPAIRRWETGASSLPSKPSRSWPGRYVPPPTSCSSTTTSATPTTTSAFSSRPSAASTPTRSSPSRPSSKASLPSTRSNAWPPAPDTPSAAHPLSSDRASSSAPAPTNMPSGSKDPSCGSRSGWGDQQDLAVKIGSFVRTFILPVVEVFEDTLTEVLDDERRRSAHRRELRGRLGHYRMTGE